MTKHINELIASRRAVLGGLLGMPLLNLASCVKPAQTSRASINFASVAATNADTVSLPPGYSWRTLIGWGDALFDTVSPAFDPDTLTRTEQEQRFGTNNDMLALFPAVYAFPPPDDAERMILCANHESASPELSFPGLASLTQFTPAHIEALLASVGVSIVALARESGEWRVLTDTAPGQGVNRRITPFTPVRFTGPAANHPWIAAASAIVNDREPGARVGEVACGTGANCAGGITPWGTYLTAEENFDGLFYGSPDDLVAPSRDDAYARDALSHDYPNTDVPAALVPEQFRIGVNPYGPSLYGWIVEIDPYDPTSTPKKRTALGRKQNECATTALTRDGRVAVYTGDDQAGEHLYKFVTSRSFDPSNRLANADLLDDGDLYAAQFLEDGQGRWLKLSFEAANAAAEAQSSPIRFRNQGDMVVRVREAAELLGATPMDRPEDVEPVRDASWRGTGAVLVCCTKNSNAGVAAAGNPRRESNSQDAQSNAAGHVLRLDEADGDNAAERFSWDVFALCGDPNANAPVVQTREGETAHISVAIDGVATFSGDRFACPDNLFIDSTNRVWITTDGSDDVFADCNDSVMVTQADSSAGRHIKRFLVAPIGAEVCGPIMTPDERALFCAIQHPGGNDVTGTDFDELRWSGRGPTSHFPDGGERWPRSAVVVIARDDGGRIGD